MTPLEKQLLDLIRRAVSEMKYARWEKGCTSVGRKVVLKEAQEMLAKHGGGVCQQS